MPNVNDLMLIFSLAVLGILALSALFGFLAGLKREIKLTVVFVVLLLLVWLVLGNVSSLLDMNLPGFATGLLQNMLGVSENASTLREIIVEFAKTNFSQFADLLVKGTYTYSFLMSILEFALRFAILLVGTIVVYVLYLVIRLISFLIKSIIRLCTIRRRRRKMAEKEAAFESGIEDGVVVVKSDVYDGEVVVTVSRNPKKFYRGKRRGWAAALGFARGLFIVILLCTPIAGLLSIVDEVKPETVDMVLNIMGGSNSNGNVAAEDNNGISDMVDWLYDLSDAYNNSPVGKTLQAPEYFLGKRLDDVFFDDLFKIETSTQTIYLHEEIITLIQIANILPEAYNKDKVIPIDIWALDDAKQDQIFDLLKQVKLLYEIMPVAIEFAGTLDMVQDILKPADQSLDALLSVDWKVDLPLILDAVRAALELGDFTSSDFDVFNLNSDVLREVVSNLGSTTFLKELMPIVINCALHMTVVENFVGEWGDNPAIDTKEVSWREELLNLVDIYDLFIALNLDFSDLDLNELLGSENKTELIETILVKLVTGNLFLDVLVPIVDVAKEFQLGNLDFAEFKGLIKLTNLESADWESDMSNIIEMAKIVQKIGVLSGEGIDLYNYTAFRELINCFFDLMILSDKVNDTAFIFTVVDEQGNIVQEKGEDGKLQPVRKQVELKTLLIEAALRQFKLFDIVDEEGNTTNVFKQFSTYDRKQISWENEREVFLNLIDQYELFVDFLNSKGNTLADFSNDILSYLNYEETFDHIIDILDVVVDSDLVLAILPRAIEKYAVPLIDAFEQGAGYDDIDANDKISAGLADKIDSKNIAAEIFNLVYLLMDANQIKAFSLLGEKIDLQLGATAYIPEKYNNGPKQLADGEAEEAEINQLYKDFEEYSEILKYRPEEDTLALVDMVERLFNSVLLKGRESKVIRIILATFLDVRIAKEDMLEYQAKIDSGSYSEKEILVKTFNLFNEHGLLTDPNFKLFKDDGTFNLDYFTSEEFLNAENVTDIVEAIITLFDSELIAVILPEFYNQKLVPDGVIPAEWVEIFQVQSNWLGKTNGLTGKELCQDIQTLLKMGLVLIDFGAMNLLDEEMDLEFAGAKEVFNEFFDLFLQLNVLEGHGNEIAALLLNAFLETELTADDFLAYDVNWGDETQRLVNVINAVFDFLANSEIDSYKELMDILEAPMDHLERFLVDDNVRQLSNILKQVGESDVLEVIGLPLINKFVVPMIEGLEAFEEDEYSGVDAAEDIRALAQILADVADAQLMEIIKAALGKFTVLLPEVDTDVVVPLRHDLYADIIENLFGLNLLNANKVKQLVIDKLIAATEGNEALEGLDLSGLKPEDLRFAEDGLIIANAYRQFVEEFSQDVYPNLTLSDIIDLIEGNSEVINLLAIISTENIYALGHLASALLDTSMANAFGIIGFNFVKTLVPENLAFLVNVQDYTNEEFISDINSIKELLQTIIDFVGPELLSEVIDGIIDGDLNITALESELNIDQLANLVETLMNTIDDMYLFDKRGAEIIGGVLDLLEVDYSSADLANIDIANSNAKIVEIVQSIADLLIDLDIKTIGDITSFADRLNDSEALVDIIEKALPRIADIIAAASEIDYLEELLVPLYNKFLKDSLVEALDIYGELVNLDFYTLLENTDKLSEDIASLGNVVKALSDSNIIGFVMGGENLDVEGLSYLGDALKELFSLNILEAKEEIILEIINDNFAGLDLSDQELNFAEDGEKLEAIIDSLVEVLESGFINITTLDALGDAIGSMDITALFTENAEGVTPAQALINILSAVTELSFLDEGIGVASQLAFVKDALGDDLGFLLDLGEKGSIGVVEDLHSIVDGVLQPLYDLGLAQAILFGDDASLLIADELADIITTIRELNYIQGKGDQLIEYVADTIGYPELKEQLPTNWDEETQKLKDVFYDIEEILENLGLCYMTDLETFEFVYNDVFSDENLALLDNIINNISNSLLVQVTLGAAVYVALPIVAESMEAPYNELFVLDDLTIGQLVNDVQDLSLLVRDLFAMNIFEALGDGSVNFYFDAEAVGDLAYYAGSEVFELLFGLNYLSAKIDTIGDILETVAPEQFDISRFNTEFLQQASELDPNISNLAYDGVALGEAYRNLVQLVFNDVDWKYSNVNAFSHIKLMDFYKAQYFDALNIAIRTILSLNTIEAIIPVGTTFILNNAGDLETILGYLFEATAAEIQEDLVNLWDAITLFNELYQYNYKEETKEFLETMNLSKLNFNLDVIQALPVIVNAIFESNMLDHLSDDRIEETVRFIVEKLGVDIDLERVNWSDLSLIFDDYVSIFDVADNNLRKAPSDYEVNRIPLALAFIANAVLETGYVDFQDIYNLLSVEDFAEIMNNENIFNKYVANSLVTAVDLLVESKLVSALFYTVYDMFIDLDSFEPELAALLNLNPGNGYNDVYEIQSDVSTILDAVKDLINFGAIEAFVLEQDIEWYNYQLLGSAIEKIFSINALKDEYKLSQIMDFLGVMVGFKDLSLFDTRNMNLAQDGELISDAICELISKLILTGEIQFDNINEVENLINLDFLALINKNNLNAVINAIDYIAQTSIVREVVYYVATYYPSIVPEDFYFFFESGITKELLYEDVLSLVNILRAVVDTEVYNILNDEDFSFVGIADNLEEIIDGILHLNVLSVDMPFILQQSMIKLFGINIPYEEYEALDLEGDYSKIYDILHIFEEVLVSNVGISSYDELMEFVNSITSIEDILNNGKLVSNYNLDAVLDILDNLVNLDLLTVIAEPLYEKLQPSLFGNPGPLFKQLFSMEDYPIELLVEDLNSIIDALRQVVDFNIVGILLDSEEIDWANSQCIDNLIETLFGLKYLNIKSEPLVQFIVKAMDLPEIEEVLVNFEEDGKQIASTIRQAIDYFLVGEVITIETLSDIEKLMSLDLFALISKQNLSVVVDVVEGIINTTLVEQVSHYIVNNYAHFIPQDFNFLFETGITGELLYQDLQSLVIVLDAAVETEIYNILIDEDFEIEGLSDKLVTIIDTLLHLNIVDLSEAEILSETFKLVFGMEIPVEDFQTVDYDLDYAKIYDVLHRAEVILTENIDVDTYVELMEFVNSIESVEAIINDRNILSNENLHEVLFILEDLVNLQLIEVLFNPFYDELMPKIFGEPGPIFSALISTEDYPVQLLVEDLNSILQALHEVVDFNALGIVLDKEVIDWENSTAIDNLIETIFGLNFLEAKLQPIFDIITATFELPKVDTTIIDIENDGKLISQAIRTLIDHFLVGDVIEFDCIDDLEHVLSMDFLTLVSKFNFHAVIDALENIIDTSLVEAVSVYFVSNCYDLLPEQLFFLFTNGLTGELLYEDLQSLVDILRAAVDTEVYNFLVDEDFELEGLAEQFTIILDGILSLNILSVDMANILYNALPIVGLEVSYEELSKVLYPLDYENIYNILDIIEKMVVVNSEIETYYELRDLLQSYDDISDVIDDRRIVSNENLHSVLDILSEVVNLQLVEVLFNPVFDKFCAPLFENAPSQIAGFLDLSDYPVELLVEDLNNIIDSLHGLADFNIIGIALDDAEIDWNTTIYVEEVIKAIFATNYLRIKEYDIINLVSSEIIDITSITPYDIDFEKDGLVVADIYKHFAHMMNDCIEANTISEIMDIKFSSKLIDDALAQYVVYILDEIDRLSFFTGLIEVGFGILAESLPKYWGILAEMGPAGVDGIVEDYNAIVDILQILVDVNAVSMVFQGYNMSFAIEEEAKEIVDLLFGLNYLALDTPENKLNTILKSLLGEMDSEYINMIDLSQINWVDEVDDTIKDIVSEVFNFLEANEIVDYNSFNEYKDELIVNGNIKITVLATVANGNILINVIDHILDSTFALAVIPAGYELLMNVLEPMYFGFLLDNITNEMLLEDVKTIFESIRNMVDDGALEIAVELLKDYDDTDIISLARSFIDEIPNILDIQILSLHKDGLVEYVVNTLGLDDYMLNYDAIIYRNETEMIRDILHIVVDMLENNELNTIHNILSIVEAGELLSDERIVNDANITALVSIMRELTRSQLIAELVIPIYNAYVDPMFSGLNNAILAELLTINYNTYSVEDFKADFVTLVELLELLDQEGTLMHIVDLVNKVDTTVIYPDSFEHIIRKVYELRLVNDRTDLIQEFICSLIGIDYFAVDSAMIDEDYDVDVIVEVVRMVCDVLIENDLTKIDEIVSAMSNLGDYLTSENCIALLDAVDKLIDLTTLQALLVPTLEKYVSPMLPEEIQSIFNNEKYELVHLVEDLHSVVSMAKEAIKFNVVYILFDNAYIDWANTAPVEAIIQEIVGLNLLGNNLQLLIDYADTIVPYIELEHMDLNNIDLENDGVVLSKVYAIIAKEILATDVFPIHFFDDIKHMTISVDDYLTKEILNIVVDALDELGNATLLEEALWAAYNSLLNNTHEKLQYLFESTLNRDQLVDDYRTVLGALREAIELEVQNFFFSEPQDISLIGADEHIINIIDALIHTNLLGSDFARTAKGTFELFKIEVSYATSATVNYEHDFDVMYEMISGLLDILINSELDSYFDIKDKLETIDLSSIQAILDETQLVNNDNLHALLNVVEKVLELDLLKVGYAPTLQTIFGDVNGTIAPLFYFSEYGVDLFIEDAEALFDVIHNFIDFNILYVLFDNEVIDWTNPAIDKLIETIFGLNYLEVKVDDIIDIISENIIDITAIKQSSLDLEADGKLIAEAVRLLIDQFLVSGQIKFTIFDDYDDVLAMDLLTLVNKENLLLVLDAVDLIIDTTIAENAPRVLLDIYPEILPVKVHFLFNTDITSDLLYEDMKSVVDILRDVVETEVYNILLDDDFLLINLSDNLSEILDGVLHLNIISIDTPHMLKNALSFIGIDVPYEDLATINYDLDYEVLYEVLGMVEDILVNNMDILTHNQLVDFVADIADLRDLYHNEIAINNDNLHALIDIVEKVINTQLFKVVFKPAYEQKVQPMLADTPQIIRELTDFTNYSIEEILEDLNSIIEPLHELVDFNVLGIVRDAEKIEWANVKPIQDFIKVVFASNYVDIYAITALEYVDSKLAISILSDADLNNINWAADGAKLAKAYEIVALGILQNDEFPVHYYNELKEFKFELDDYMNNDYANALIDAFEAVVNSTLVYELSTGVLDYVNIQFVPVGLRYIINDANLTKDLAVEDFESIIDLARIAVDAGIIDYYHNDDILLTQPIAIKRAIKILFDLNVLENSETRITSINKVLGRLGLEPITTVTDWDNEEAVLISLVDDVCALLNANDLSYLTNLVDFVQTQGYKERSFLSDENLYAILDILEIACDSEIALQVLADVYNNKAVDLVPYASIRELIAFGTDARDYNEEMFVKDLKPVIDILRDFVELGIVDLYFDKDADIPTALVINSVMDKGLALNLFVNRLDLFAEVVFNYLNVDVDLTGIDWDNEVSVLQNVITIVVPALYGSDIFTIQDVLSVISIARGDIVSFIKDNRQYVNLTNAITGVDVLDELGNSEVYMRSILKLYARFQHKLPSIITSNIDMSLYKEVELRADYPNIIEILRETLTSQVYRVLIDRRAYTFPEEHVASYQKIIDLGCDLHFTRLYTAGMIRIVAQYLDINLDGVDIEAIDLAEDKEELINMVEPFRYFWINSNSLRPTIPMLANEELFNKLSVILKEFGNTTLHNVLTPFVYKQYLAGRISGIADSTGIESIRPLANYNNDEILGLYTDAVFVLDELIAMDLFTSTGVDFTDTTHLTNVYNTMRKYITLSERITRQLDIVVSNSHLLGVIYIPYTEVTDSSLEVDTLKSIARNALDFINNYKSRISKDNLSVLATPEFENDVMVLLNMISESILLEETFIPLVNGLVDARLGDSYASYNAIPMATYEEFYNEVPGLFDMIRKADKVGALTLDIMYKDTEGIEELVRAIENSPFISGQETMITKIFLRVTKKLDPESMDFSHIVWANEYQYIYAFLERANYPLNMDGVTISSDINATLADPEFVKPMCEALEELADSQVLVVFFEPLFNYVGDTRFESIKDLMNYDHLDGMPYDDYALVIKAEYLNVLETVVLASELGLVGKEQSVMNVEKLLQLYDNIFALAGTTNTKPEIFEKLVKFLPNIGDEEVAIPEGIDYDQEIIAVRAIIKSLEGFADINGNIDTEEINDIATTCTDAAALEAMFTALNMSQIYRQNFYSLIEEHIADSGSGDMNLNNFLTPWFKDQKVNGMENVDSWEEEVILLARLVAISNYMKNNSTGLDSIENIKLGVVDSNNAATIDTSSFMVADYGLRQILQIISHSKSFTLTALNGVLEDVLVDRSADKSGNGIIKTQKHLVELTDAQWDSEIDNVIDLLHNVQVLGLLNSSTPISEQLTTLTAEQVAAVIKSFNHCAAIRELLPDMISDALVSANAGSYKAEWLDNQCGVDASGNNNPMASIAEWDAEADQLSEIISATKEFNFDSLNLASLTDEQIDALGNVLHAMNDANSINIDQLISIINDLLEEKGYNVVVNKLVDRNANGNNKDEWNSEIPRLMDIVKKINNVGAIDNDCVTAHSHELGELLDAMKVSYIFGNDTHNDGSLTTDDNTFNSLVMEVLNSSKLLKNSSNSNGFIDEAKASTTDWSTYNWTQELDIVANFDTDANVQSDDTIKALASSQIIKDFYDIAGVINDKIADKEIIISGVGITLKLADYVNGGAPLTNDDLAGRDWAEEIDDMNTIVEIFNNGYKAGFKSDLEALIASGHTTMAVETATSIKAALVEQTVPGLGVSVWDILL